jgi:hypothetical protein
MAPLLCWSVHQWPEVPVALVVVGSVVVVDPAVVGADGVVSAPDTVEDRVEAVSVVPEVPVALVAVGLVVVVDPTAAGADEVVSVPDTVEDRAGVVSAVPDDPLLPEVLVDVVVVVPLPPAVLSLDAVLLLSPAGVLAVDGGVMKLMLLDEPAATLLEVIAALLPEAAAPSLANRPEPRLVAEGLEPDVTEKVSVPALDSSHGRFEAGCPPSRLAPMTYRFRSVVSMAHCPGGSPGVPGG